MNVVNGSDLPCGNRPEAWALIEKSLDAHGHATLPGILTKFQCTELMDMYSQERRYRSRVVMARHGFGSGEYQYFSYPLPETVSRLRTTLYPWLMPIANRWNELLGIPIAYPERLAAFLDLCHDAGQHKPTPLMLKYMAGDYNCLHQDIYGEHIFPLQVAILLSQPGSDFTGGEFVMTEKSSSRYRADVISLQQGDGIVFTVHQRPILSNRRIVKATMRHGVSRVRQGNRYTVGLIFHDAR